MTSPQTNHEIADLIEKLINSENVSQVDNEISKILPQYQCFIYNSEESIRIIGVATASAKEFYVPAFEMSFSNEGFDESLAFKEIKRYLDRKNLTNIARKIFGEKIVSYFTKPEETEKAFYHFTQTGFNSGIPEIGQTSAASCIVACSKSLGENLVTLSNIELYEKTQFSELLSLLEENGKVPYLLVADYEGEGVKLRGRALEEDSMDFLQMITRNFYEFTNEGSAYFIKSSFLNFLKAADNLVSRETHVYYFSANVVEAVDELIRTPIPDECLVNSTIFVSYKGNEYMIQHNFREAMTGKPFERVTVNIFDKTTISVNEKSGAPASETAEFCEYFQRIIGGKFIADKKNIVFVPENLKTEKDLADLMKIYSEKFESVLHIAVTYINVPTDIRNQLSRDIYQIKKSR